eukprot:7384222-Prymnesium_polylepis.5
MASDGPFWMPLLRNETAPKPLLCSLGIVPDKLTEPSAVQQHQCRARSCGCRASVRVAGAHSSSQLGCTARGCSQSGRCQPVLQSR